jgi:single-stranded-DNA-specific exonuclease
VSSTITPEQEVPEIEIDAEIPLSLVKPAVHNIIKQFEPFGPANMRPVFISRELHDYQGKSTIVKEQHLRIVAHQKNGAVVEGIGFGLAEKFDIVHGGPFDMVYTMDENEFNGTARLQVRVIDVRKSERTN